MYDSLGRHQEGDDNFRHLLYERWADGPLIGWVGMNPSYASEEESDLTWNRWLEFSHRWGYGGQIALNPVNKRASKPDDAKDWLQSVRIGRIERTPLMTNRGHARKVASETIAWVIGWGDAGAAMDRILPVLGEFIEALHEGAKQNVTFLAFGLTKKQNPIHVLGSRGRPIPGDAAVFEYDPIRKRIGVTPWKHPNAW